MLSAGRRIPVRLQQSVASAPSSHLLRHAVAINGNGAAAHLHPLAQQQARTFFGLRDLLFGKKDEAAADDKKAPVAATVKANDGTSSVNAAAAAAADAAASEAAEAVPQEKLVGSLDETNFSVGKYARLADGSVMATCGKTMVLTTAVSSVGGKRGRDFLPLMVDYRVKYYATGLIPDTAKRTEFSGTDEEILQSRVVDRVIRPLFPRDYFDDTQVIATVQSLDPNNDPLIVAINSTSAALAVSDIPWNGPVGAVRVVEIDGQLVVNPTKQQRDIATLDILYAANETRTLMIEASGEEITEDRMAEALKFAHDAVGPIIETQEKLVKQFGKPKRSYMRLIVDDEVMEKAKETGLEEAKLVLSTPKLTKVERQEGEKHVYGKIISTLREHFQGRDFDDAQFQMAAHDVFQQALREQILSGDKNARYDGRSPFTIRPLKVETDVLPMAHGSSVFTRGDTQALCSVTLGPLDRGLKVRSAQMDPTKDIPLKHAMLHYEFPPYCVNETGRVGGVNRRMIGHGALAEKALVPVIPSIDQFPYTVRMTSETMGSDGSSSMATVCGVSLALMDAGVPIKAPVAGISIGLITEGDPFDGEKEIKNYRLITDILGTEDHYGDMDFKIAGTDTGITAIQLDVKLPGIPLDILCKGIHYAKKARTNILRKMNATIAEPRKELKNSPTGEINIGLEFSIPVSSIGVLIGAGGSNIRELERTFEVTVSIDRKTGALRVVGLPENAENAKQSILDQTAQANDAFFKRGAKYMMRVHEVMDFGAVLESTSPSKNRGFVHITELAHYRVENIHDVISVGQELEFECIQEGFSGKMSLKTLLPGSSSSTASNASESSTSQQDATPHKRPSNQRRSKGSHAGKLSTPRMGGSVHRRPHSPQRSSSSSDATN
ncbi:Polyribonucleotide nucleotidyltransferase, partial [Globisporangium splendens]